MHVSGVCSVDVLVISIGSVWAAGSYNPSSYTRDDRQLGWNMYCCIMRWDEDDEVWILIYRRSCTRTARSERTHSATGCCSTILWTRWYLSAQLITWDTLLQKPKHRHSVTFVLYQSFTYLHFLLQSPKQHVFALVFAWGSSYTTQEINFLHTGIHSQTHRTCTVMARAWGTMGGSIAGGIWETTMRQVTYANSKSASEATL
jgi:hypothetical protein